MAGDRVSGWRLDCPGCGEPSLLPEALAREGARVRCPGCRTVFAAADPARVDACERALEEWLAGVPGGRGAIARAREEARFWGEHGASFLDWRDASGAGFGAETVRAALARALGPGRDLFGGEGRG